MSTPAALAHMQLSLPQFDGLTRRERAHLLGVTHIGLAAAAPQGGLPVQTLEAPLLGAAHATMSEIWHSARAPRSGEDAGIRFRHDDQLLYGVLDVEDAAFPATEGATPLQAATADAYARIFRLIEAHGCPHLWRVWNYVSDINLDSHGLERYRQFNVGREQAFVASGRLARGEIPAACALGLAKGPLTIAFMAGRSAPAAIENPRQVSAYRYPAQYGPRSPTFSRAAISHLPGQELLFVSGTASIVGHRSMHVGDAAAQTEETFANLEAILAETERAARTPRYRLEELRLRAYLRRAADLPAVRGVIERRMGIGAQVVYVQADICRAELLVEIEAFASHTMGNC